MPSAWFQNYSSLPVPLPERAIFARLGETLKEKWLNTVMAFHQFCVPQGRSLLLNIQKIDENGIWFTVPEEGKTFFLQGGQFATRCQGAIQLWCVAATVGKEVIQHRDSLASVTEQLICDTVASETADATLDSLQELAKKTLRQRGLFLSTWRYSAGYGDMPLSMQQLSFQLLHLDKLGLILNHAFLFSPEKTVTAWAPIFQHE